MATVFINERIKAGKMFLEFLKTQSWAKVVEKEKRPNANTRQAIKEAEKGKAFKAKHAEDLFNQLDI